jgi:HEAT repeat protein
LKNATEDSLPKLGKQLDDPHPDVRQKARRALLDRAVKGAQRKEVIGQGVAALAGKPWRAQEQAAILLADLDHRPAGARLAELLSADRPEVFVTAAWALRRLGDTESLPAVLAYLTAEEQRFSRNNALPGRKGGRPDLVNHQMSQLCQLFGRLRHAPAEPVLRRFVPRNDKAPMPEARAAAIWALGFLHEGKPVAALAAALEGRLNDVLSLPPEDARVRRMAAVTLGRMKAKDSLASLRKYSPDQQMSEDVIASVCAWAIERITSEKARPATPRKVTMRDWFLVPND